MTYAAYEITELLRNLDFTIFFLTPNFPFHIFKDTLKKGTNV